MPDEQSENEIIRSVYLATSLDAYRHFWDSEWAESVQELVKHRPKLAEIILGLMFGWKCAAYTAEVPAAAIESTKSYHDGFVKTGKINTMLLQIAEGIPAKLNQKLPNMNVHPPFQREIQAAVLEIAHELAEARVKALNESDFPLEEMWQQHLSQPAFQLILFGSQHLCFISVYNSFEDFLVRAVKRANSLDRCRTSSSKFQSQFEEAFGKALFEKCWTNKQIEIARLARHSISHAGGQLTADLKSKSHGFEVRQDRIQVTPEKNRELFTLLKEAVYALAEKAATMSQFS